MLVQWGWQIETEVMEFLRTLRPQEIAKITGDFCFVFTTPNFCPQQLVHIWKGLYACSGSCQKENGRKVTRP